MSKHFEQINKSRFVTLARMAIAKQVMGKAAADLTHTENYLRTIHQHLHGFVESGKQSYQISPRLCRAFSSMESDVHYLSEAMVPYPSIFVQPDVVLPEDTIPTEYAELGTLHYELAGFYVSRSKVTSKQNMDVMLFEDVLAICAAGLPNDTQRKDVAERQMRYADYSRERAEDYARGDDATLQWFLPVNMPLEEAVDYCIQKIPNMEVRFASAQAEGMLSIREKMLRWSRFIINFLRYLDNRFVDMQQTAKAPPVNEARIAELVAKKDLKPNEQRKLEAEERKRYITNVYSVGAQIEKMAAAQERLIRERCSPEAHVVEGHFQRYGVGPREKGEREWRWKDPFIKGIEDANLLHEVATLRKAYRIH